MVKVETRIQLAIKEILEEETWKHLKTLVGATGFEPVTSSL